MTVARSSTGGDDYGGGYIVLEFEVEELDALGAAAGGADGFSGDAEDLAELADNHELAGLVDKVDAEDLADLGSRLHVDDALAAAGLKAVVVDVGALAAAGLRDREDEAEPNSQNGNLSKINPEKVACVSSPNSDRQLPSFHQQSTTTSPSKNHVLPPVFAKTPSKNKVPPLPKIIAKAPLFEQGFGFFGGMTTVATLSWSSRSRTLAPPNPLPPLHRAATPSRDKGGS